MSNACTEPTWSVGRWGRGPGRGWGRGQGGGGGGERGRRDEYCCFVTGEFRHR